MPNESHRVDNLSIPDKVEKVLQLMESYDPNETASGYKLKRYAQEIREAFKQL